MLENDMLREEKKVLKKFRIKEKFEGTRSLYTWAYDADDAIDKFEKRECLEWELSETDKTEVFYDSLEEV